MEVCPDPMGRIPNRCPVCDGHFDSAPSQAPTAESRLSLVFASSAQIGGGKGWAETWDKGNMGTIGRFQIRETLGDGGFGIVYKAIDPRLDRDVALKVLKQPNPNERVMERFFREARAAALLRHPNIVSVFDAGKDDQRVWIAYEFIKGRPLSRHIDSRSLDIPSSVRIILDLAHALSHAHRVGVYHRDIKPANVIIDEFGNAHLIDFGLASRADLRSDLTKEGAILGTPDYRPPEQASGNSHLADERSDIYSLGKIFFELLYGRRASDSSSGSRKSVAEPLDFVPPSNPTRKIPNALERICMRALESDPVHRYGTADELAIVLERWVKTRDDLSIIAHPAMNFAFGVVGTLLLVIGLQLMLGLPFHSAPTRHDEVVIQRQSSAKTPLAASASKKRTPLFIGNKSTHLLHTADCQSLPSVNREEIFSLEEAIEKNYNKECAKCWPPELRQKLSALEAARAGR